MEINSGSRLPEAPQPKPHGVCHEIAEEVREMAIALYTGQLSPALFEKALLTLEAAKVKRFGLRLAAERLPDGGSRFRVASAATDETCATLDFNPLLDKLEIHDSCA